MKRYMKRLLEAQGKVLVGLDNFNALQAQANAHTNTMLDDLLEIRNPRARSRAQLKQDIIALLLHDFREGGFFVEFGATDGETLSNTALLEKDFGWSGILAEPCRRWHAALRENRTCRIDTRCVWSRSGERLPFTEADVGELSTISRFADRGSHAKARQNGRQYEVETVSLADLLKTHDAPEKIDYLSIDTEGSELEILRAFDLAAHDITFISCEHNHTPARRSIHDYMTQHGYRRILPHRSRFDDWYLRTPTP